MSVPWANGALLSFLSSSNPYSSNVRIIGKITQSNPSNGQSTIEACDGKEVIIHSQNGYQVGNRVCISGRVMPDGSVEETSCYTVEDNFDMSLMNEMIFYTQKCSSLFG